MSGHCCERVKCMACGRVSRKRACEYGSDEDVCKKCQRFAKEQNELYAKERRAPRYAKEEWF